MECVCVCTCVCLLAALTQSKTVGRVIKLTARPHIEANYHLLHWRHTQTHTLSHARTYLYWRTSRGSPIKPGNSLLYTEVWVPEGANNIPEKAAMFQLVSFRKPSNWHSQWTPGDQRRMSAFIGIQVCMCAFVSVCARVMSAWGKPRDYYKIATISYWWICTLWLSLKKNKKLSAQ